MIPNVQEASGRIRRCDQFDKLLERLIEEAWEQEDLTEERARELVDRFLPGELARDFLAYQLRFWAQ